MSNVFTLPLMSERPRYMGTIVNIETGEFVATGDIGNLAETLMVLSEMGRADNLRLYPEDEAYSEF